jgi:hypothetical protein
MSNREKVAIRAQLREEAYQEWLNQPPILSNFYTVTIHIELHNVYFDLIHTICYFDFIIYTSTNS